MNIMSSGLFAHYRGRYSPSSPTREEEEDEIQEVVIEEEALPSRIFDCPGTVVIYQVKLCSVKFLKRDFKTTSRRWRGRAFSRWRMAVARLSTVSF